MQNLLFINGNNVELFAWSCHRLNYYSVGSAPICSQSHGACTCRPSRVAASLPESKLSSVTPPTFGQKRNMNCTWMQSTGKLAQETRTFTAWPITERFCYRNIHYGWTCVPVLTADALVFKMHMQYIQLDQSLCILVVVRRRTWICIRRTPWTASTCSCRT